MNPILLLAVCVLLGSAVFASVVALAFAIAWLPRVWLRYRGRALERAVTGG